jgi:xanthine dehydrogenase YagS FAD-binding subunit
MEGVNRKLAVLGTSSHCIANYPGDFAVALAALGATVDIEGQGGRRVLAFEDLHRLPGDTPHIETSLKPGELITGFTVPPGPWTRRSLYLKIRDRVSYEFALTSAAVALDLDGDTVREARIGLGGLAAKPWRSHEAEAALRGRRLDEATASAAADAALAQASGHGDLAFKKALGHRTLVRALLQARAMEV